MEGESQDNKKQVRRPNTPRQASYQKKLAKERLQAIHSVENDPSGNLDLIQTQKDIPINCDQNGDTGEQSQVKPVLSIQTVADGDENNNELGTLSTQATEKLQQLGTLSTQATVASQVDSVSTTETTRGHHILVVEDNKVNQEVIVRMLKLEKISSVILAEDGLQAVDKVRESMSSNGAEDTISLVFMDIQMPNLDGIEATKQVRDMGFKGPIVALTAYDHETNREACWQAGVHDFRGKPIKRKLLRQTLQKFARDGAELGTGKGKEKV